MTKAKRLIFLFLIIFLFSLGLFFPFQKINFQENIEKIKFLFSQNKESPNFQTFYFGSFLNYDFFTKTKNALIEEKVDFLLVDLSNKELQFFEKGKLKKTYQVLSIGKKGSFWETPTGFYQVERKIKNAFSRMGGVYMPYSLLFQGNFYIHGWPYFPDGTPVSSTFSGGCIRLSNDDAKEIFEKVEIGTPILIFDSSFFGDNFAYQLKPPEISAKAYLAADLKSNFIFLEKNKNEVLPIASITKLITALVATEYINLWKEIVISKSDLIPTSKPRLKAGEVWTGFDLLYPLLNESSNEAAKAISRFLGEEKFVEAMNKKAKSLGMESAHFEDPSGISPENKASIKDLYFLAKYLYFNRRFILDITRGKIYPDLLTKSFKDLKNLNCFSGNENFVGGKIGKTPEAGGTSISILEIDFKGEKRPIAIIILGSSNVCEESQKILDWIKNSFQ